MIPQKPKNEQYSNSFSPISRGKQKNLQKCKSAPDTLVNLMKALNISDSQDQQSSKISNLTFTAKQAIIQTSDQQTTKIQFQEKKELISNDKSVKNQKIVQAEKTESQTDEVEKGTQRPDGTWRKDVRIRQGYKNAEMIKLYVVPQKRDKQK